MKSSNCRPMLILCSAPHGVPTLLILLFLSSPFLRSAAAQPSSDSSSSDGDSLQNSNISPSMALIVVVLVLAFFITGTVSIYIQCARSSQSSGGTITGAGVSRSRRGNAARGLDRSVIEAFPNFVYSSVKELKIGKGSLECAVCLSEFQDSDNLRLLTKCDHVFHSDCIDTWLAAHTTCPVCRANLVPDPADSTILDADSEIEPDPSSSGADGIPSSEIQVTVADGGEGTAVREGIPKLKFPRSHSTGHSLIRPGEEIDRFTLRLPADVRRQLLARAKLKRATSLVALPRASSSRQGYRSGAGEGSGSSRYGRFFGRSLRIGSFRLTAKVGADVDATTSTSSRRVLGTAVTPSETLPTLPV